MGPEIVGPVGVFTAIVAVVWLVQAYGSRNRTAFQETVRAAIDRGVELSPDTIKALGAPRRSRFADIKWGVIWIALAAACVVFGWAVGAAEGEPEILLIFSGIAAFPGFVGVALLGYGVVTFRAENGVI